MCILSSCLPVSSLRATLGEGVVCWGRQPTTFAAPRDEKVFIADGAGIFSMPWGSFRCRSWCCYPAAATSEIRSTNRQPGNNAFSAPPPRPLTPHPHPQPRPLFQAGDAVEALRRYSSALSHTPDDHLLHSNRSMALAKLGRWSKSEQVRVLCVLLPTPSGGLVLSIS